MKTQSHLTSCFYRKLHCPCFPINSLFSSQFPVGDGGRNRLLLPERTEGRFRKPGSEETVVDRGVENQRLSPMSGVSYRVGVVGWQEMFTVVGVRVSSWGTNIDKGDCEGHSDLRCYFVRKEGGRRWNGGSGVRVRRERKHCHLIGENGGWSFHSGPEGSSEY